MFVPQFTGYTDGSYLLLVDYPDDFEAQAIADATGTATITTSAVDAGYLWRVERMTTYVTTAAGALTTPPAGAALGVYKGTAVAPIAFRDGSQSPGLDVADESQPIIVQSTSQLTLQWTGLAPGSIAACSIQYALLRRITGLG